MEGINPSESIAIDRLRRLAKLIRDETENKDAYLDQNTVQQNATTGEFSAIIMNIPNPGTKVSDALKKILGPAAIGTCTGKDMYSVLFHLVIATRVEPPVKDATGSSFPLTLKRLSLVIVVILILAFLYIQISSSVEASYAAYIAEENSIEAFTNEGEYIPEGQFLGEHLE